MDLLVEPFGQYGYAGYTRGHYPTVQPAHTYVRCSMLYGPSASWRRHFDRWTSVG